ncbi:MAG: RNA-binding S4 domain-containing protein [Mycobacteriales bacterium]
MRDVEVRAEGIRLGQLLKLAGFAATGSDAKLLLELGEVEVNGQPEARRGRQLTGGDVVECGEESVRLTLG